MGKIKDTTIPDWEWFEMVECAECGLVPPECSGCE